MHHRPNYDGADPLERTRCRDRLPTWGGGLPEEGTFAASFPAVQFEECRGDIKAALNIMRGCWSRTNCLRSRETSDMLSILVVWLCEVKSLIHSDALINPPNSKSRFVGLVGVSQKGKSSGLLCRHWQEPPWSLSRVFYVLVDSCEIGEKGGKGTNDLREGTCNPNVNNEATWHMTQLTYIDL